MLTRTCGGAGGAHADIVPHNTLTSPRGGFTYNVWRPGVGHVKRGSTTTLAAAKRAATALMLGRKRRRRR